MSGIREVSPHLWHSVFSNMGEETRRLSAIFEDGVSVVVVAKGTGDVLGTALLRPHKNREGYYTLLERLIPTEVGVAVNGEKIPKAVLWKCAGCEWVDNKPQLRCPRCGREE